MGVGEMYCLESGPDTEPIAVTKDTAIVEFFKQFNPVLEQKDEKLMRQAEEIGRLREQLEQARRDIERLEVGKNGSTHRRVPEPIDIAT